MKKETTIALISLLIVSLIVTYYYKKDGDTKPKVGLGKVTLNKVDTLRSYSNEAVMIETIYSYQGDNLDKKRQLANRMRIKEFTMSKSSIELYELNLPHILRGSNILITDVKIEAQLLPKVKKAKRERDAIMDILTDKIENNEWKINFSGGVMIMYNKIDSLKIMQIKPLNEISVMFKGKELRLSRKEQAIIDAHINKRLAYDKMNDEVKTKREFLKKFGKKK